MIEPSLEEDLIAAVGASHVVTDPEQVASYATDWTGRFSGDARLAVRPGNVREVAEALRICARHGVAIVPQGGNTGLVGGSVPRAAPGLPSAPSAANPHRDPSGPDRDPGEPSHAAGAGLADRDQVVLSLVRLDDLGSVDAATMQVEAGAGVTLGELQSTAGDAGLAAGLDLGARESATVGGLAACDAGGTHAMRYGTARARIAGLEAVLADGSIVRRMSGLLKDNAGYDLPSLLIGSEGTLGVITAVRWKLVPRQRSRVAALIGLDSLEAAARLFADVRPLLVSLEAADFFTREGLALVREHLRVGAPMAGEHEVYVLIECAGAEDPLPALAGALEHLPADRVVIAEGTSERERMWRLREAQAEAIAAAGVPHKIDVGVPLARLGEFADRLSDVLAETAPPAQAFLFGHLGDGNVHVNLLGLGAGDEQVDLAVMELAAASGGTISAEHGIGAAKAQHLGLCRSAEEIEAMRRLKRALDPDGILNPGAVLP